MFSTIGEGLKAYKAELWKLVEDAEREASNAKILGVQGVDTDPIEARYARLRAMESCLGLTELEVQALHAEFQAPLTIDFFWDGIHQELQQK